MNPREVSDQEEEAAHEAALPQIEAANLRTGDVVAGYGTVERVSGCMDGSTLVDFAGPIHAYAQRQFEILEKVTVERFARPAGPARDFAAEIRSVQDQFGWLDTKDPEALLALASAGVALCRTLDVMARELQSLRPPPAPPRELPMLFRRGDRFRVRPDVEFGWAARGRILRDVVVGDLYADVEFDDPAVGAGFDDEIEVRKIEREVES